MTQLPEYAMHIAPCANISISSPDSAFISFASRMLTSLPNTMRSTPWLRKKDADDEFKHEAWVERCTLSFELF
jgi:hypothetical protein